MMRYLGSELARYVMSSTNSVGTRRGGERECRRQVSRALVEQGKLPGHLMLCCGVRPGLLMSWPESSKARAVQVASGSVRTKSGRPGRIPALRMTSTIFCGAVVVVTVVVAPVVVLLPLLVDPVVFAAITDVVAEHPSQARAVRLHVAQLEATETRAKRVP
jgi:hypothetical protein